jgi:hypothetical protein
MALALHVLPWHPKALEGDWSGKGGPDEKYVGLCDDSSVGIVFGGHLPRAAGEQH